MARWYAKQTGKSLSEFQILAGRIAGELRPGSQRTRSSARARLLRDRTGEARRYRVTGLDISQTFVEIAQKNAAAAG